MSATHCRKGHPFNEANTYVRPDGSRYCRACVRERVAARREEERRQWEAMRPQLEAAVALRERLAPEFMRDSDGCDYVYGFPCTSDPRDFLPDPDPDCVSPEELMRWAEDYSRAEAGESVAWPGGYWATADIHISRTAWGMGVTRYRENEEAVS